MQLFVRARECSLKSKYKKGQRIGAIIVIGNKIISMASNETKSHPIQFKLNPLRFEASKYDRCHNYIHAEMKCILKCKDVDFKKAKIYVYREDLHGRLRMCRPCNACMAMIKEVGIRHVYYTSPDGFVHEVIA